MQTDLSEAQEKIKANTSSITQNADKISFMVTGDKESEFTVTDKFIQMISDHISIDASTIDINGIITAMNTHTGPGKTKIDGGIIETNTITADSIKVDAIRSKIFEDDLTSNYSLKGIWFDLSENGAIKGENFAVDSNGNAYIRGDSTVEGTIIANKGYIGGIGGFHIEAGKLYSGMDTFPEQPTSISKDKNVYIGTDGIALGGGNFRVDPNGKLYANSGTFSGTIYADGGTIGGWNISANSLSNRDGSISLNPDGLKLGNQLNIDNQGNATFGGKLSAATGSFSGELVAATGSFSGELKAARGSFKGELSGATGSFTGDITATSIYAQDTYYIYNGTQTKNAKVIWCDTLTYEWNPSKDIIDFKIGTQDKAYLNFLTYTLNNHVNREASMCAVTSASVISRVKCETGDTTSAVVLESQSLSSYNIAAVQLRSTSNGCCLMPGNYDDSTYDEKINLGVSNNKWNQVFSKDLLFTGILSNARKNGVEFYDHGNTASTSAAISIRPIYNGTADEGSGKNSGSNVYSRVNLGTDKCHFRTLYVDRIVLGSDSTVHTTWGGSGGSSITSATASATSVSSSNSASASVDLSSDKKTLSFSFNIPRGKDGTNGKDGTRGPRGYQGEPGPQGPPGEPGSSLSSGDCEVGMVTDRPRSFSPLRNTFHLGHAGSYKWVDVYAILPLLITAVSEIKTTISNIEKKVESATTKSDEAKNAVDILKQNMTSYDTQFEGINTDITDVKAAIEEIKKNPAAAEYDVTYENSIFTFLKDGEIQKSFKIEGGGGSSSDTTTITIENTYYNVIDEYDSVNVINDSSVTANSTFSSTKSEKTYAKKSTLVNTTLTASKWTGSSAPYSYVLSVSGVTSSNIVEIDYASNASSAAIEAYQNAMLADGGQTTNQITIKATEKPTVDIPITIVIRNDL